MNFRDTYQKIFPHIHQHWNHDYLSANKLLIVFAMAFFEGSVTPAWFANCVQLDKASLTCSIIWLTLFTLKYFAKLYICHEIGSKTK
ncbi:hypothetical protein PEPS_47670 (plasmid) [Persicobacter psychrovividus]|uniref:Uncharacterized protein n=1 Tax=Persicobacter psychrovividus TaxID=387638 RepID=A0ABM7VND2_9BACT|nr:hypothetical protein PEPS_47670 [Persicobacter psychrovividus]